MKMPIKGLSCMISARQEKRVPSRKAAQVGLRWWFRARRPGIPGISMYQLGKISHKYLRVVPENCWYLLFTSINSSLSSNYTPEDLSYHRLNAYSLCLFVFVCHCLSHYLFACLPWGFFGLAGTAGAHGQDVAGAIDAGHLMMLYRTW